MTFFVCFNLLLRFIISDSILLYASGKKRERLDESEEEVMHSKNRKEKLEKELAGYGEDLKDIERSLQLDKNLPDSQKEFNAEAKQLKEDYPSFFDEDSENTIKEGLEQLKQYLEGEVNSAKSKNDELNTFHENKKIKQDSSGVVNDGSEPTFIGDLDGGE
jgi:GTPase involved in cell partitioning and DNA repair